MSVQITCDVSALTSEEHRYHHKKSFELFSQVKKVKVLPNGYAFQLPPHCLEIISEFIVYNRKCCAFIEHSLTAETSVGNTWLTLTGEQGVKEAIAADIRQLKILPPQIAMESGMD